MNDANRRTALTLKQARRYARAYTTEGDIVVGDVTAITPYGVTVDGETIAWDKLDTIEDGSSA